MPHHELLARLAPIARPERVGQALILNVFNEESQRFLGANWHYDETGSTRLAATQLPIVRVNTDNQAFLVLPEAPPFYTGGNNTLEKSRGGNK
jgi:hypothetical protein